MHAHTEGHTIRWAWLYDPVVQLISMGRERELRRQTLALVPPQPGWRVLDVGCGTGSLAIAALRQEPSLVVHGVDPSPQMIARARRKAGSALVRADFQQATIEDLPFGDGTVDLVTSSLMMHHLPTTTLRAGLAEVYRVLEPAGSLVVVDFDGGGPWMHRLGALVHGKPHPSRPADTVVEALRAQGFTEPVLHPMRPRTLYGLSTTKPG